ncbi:hypothetical protein L6452_16823 [Arctium lappa]|uniref:Uncharacterized protein n=1 Tax=Arctium lappa TaxID=4217 RepID=A0ACB9C1K4_ARCLA|nr:hypothetical protein L6452_16823 [Arctium lappa]
MFDIKDGKVIFRIFIYPKANVGFGVRVSVAIDNRINRIASTSYFRHRFKGRAEREGMMVIWQKTQKKQI